MKSIKYQSRLCKSDAAIIGFNLKGLKIVVVTCTIIILSICNSAYGRKDLKCGDEIRVETRDGMLIQGKLRMNQNGLLRLSNGDKSSTLSPIKLSDVKTMYHIRRATKEGAIFFTFAGAAVGFIIAMHSHIDDNRGGTGWFSGLEELEERINRGVILTFGGAVIGAILGSIIGYNIQRLHEIQIEAIPQCFSASGDKFLLKVNLAIGS